ncbi:MAG: T9SS type A sorting domain-containing protein [Flavobacteriales bacterium]|jgi:hypothetical protein
MITTITRSFLFLLLCLGCYELQAVTILEQNFQTSGSLPGTLPAGWTTNNVLLADGTTGPAFRVYNATTANAGSYWPVPEQGVNNRFAGANDDAAPCDCLMDEVYLQTPSMNFSAAANPAVTFNIYHDGNFGGGDARLQISTDGGFSWIQVDYPNDVDGLFTISDGFWQTLVITLFEFGGQADVRLRFVWSDAGSWASGFAVDNVVVGDLEPVSLTVERSIAADWLAPFFGQNYWDYSQIPLSQVAPIKATGVVYNSGLNTLNNASVNFEVLNGSTSQGIWSTPVPSLNSLTRDTLSYTTTYTPSSTGTYTVKVSGNAGAAELNTSDNVATSSFQVTECTYARDAGSAQAFFQLESGDLAGNLFDIYQDQTFYNIEVALGGGSTVGGTVIGAIFELTGFDATTGDPNFVYLDGSQTVEVAVLDTDLNTVGGSDFICLPFENPVTLVAGGVYWIVVTGTDILRLPVSGSNNVPGSWVYTDADGTYGWTQGIFMARLQGACSEACQGEISGCTDVFACNYNPQANISDGSCTYPGCTNSEALNYDPNAGCSSDNCICAAYTELFNDNCESYLPSQGLTLQSAVWTTWDGSAGLDAEVSQDYAFSGSKSIKIDGTNTDLVLPVGPYNSGYYEVSFKMLVTSSGGYFNFQHLWSETSTNYEWAFDVFFNSSGNMELYTGAILSGTTTVPLFSWFDIRVMVNMDDDLGLLYVDDILIDSWQWSLNNADGSAGVNAFAAVNFFGSNTANGQGLYYIDDIRIQSVSAISCNENIPGCTNISACNYNPTATINDGSCLVIGSGCNDFNPSTINDVIQNNCQCIGTPIDPGCSGFSVSNNTSNPTCAGLSNGFISVNAAGTSSPFSYSWSNGSSTSAINNVAAGAYSVTISDALGCSETLNFNLTAPQALNAVVSSIPVNCYGASTGSASVNVSGGTAPYTYAWTTSPIQNSAQISNVAAGNYTVNIIDANGCSFSAVATITEPITPLSVTATATSAACSQNDGTASALVNGNTGAVQYLWSNGQTGATATNLAAGNYTVTITSGGCSAQTAVNVNNTNAPIINHVSNSPQCFGESTGSINTVITGGTQPYQYLWSNGGSGTSQTGLTAGTYTFVVIDNVGCQASINVNLTQPNPINIALSATPTNCSGAPQGAVNATVSGGTQPYLYSWSNGSGGTAINNLSAGQYSLSITDAAGCNAQASASVLNPDGIVAFAVPYDINCIGGSDGAVEIFVTEGTPPYSYEWNNGETGTPYITNLQEGEYSCIITDAVGCTYTTGATVVAPQGNLPDILGMATVDPFSIQTYSISSISGATLTWAVTGGNILSGQGTNFIQVQWSDEPIAAVVLLIFYPNGCQASVDLIVQIGTTVQESVTPTTWTLYPNPAAEVLHVEIMNTMEKMPFSVSDALGKTVLCGTLQPGVNRLNLETIASGVYTLSVNTDEHNRQTRRFIRE